jgi:TolA-binding protein
MANAGEQGMAGHAPIDPIPEFRGQESHGAGDARSVKVDMGQGPPIRRPAARPGNTSGATIVISSALALLLGGAGAWAYERFLAQPKVEKPPAVSTSPERESAAEKNLARLELRINDLSRQYKDIESRLELIPKAAPSTDLAPLEQKIARVDGLSQQVEAIGKKLDPLPQQLAQSEQKLTQLDAKLGELRKEVSVARIRTAPSVSRDDSTSRTSAPSPADRPESATAPSEKGESGESAYESGVGRFRDKQYREAYDIFRKQLQSQPDDARIWYYAALSYGLATRDWGRDTEVMAQEGVAREKAGKPPKSEIDSAFAGLTKETGKEWLDFYRQRAR